jgi:hypothetical protein
VTALQFGTLNNSSINQLVAGFRLPFIFLRQAAFWPQYRNFDPPSPSLLPLRTVPRVVYRQHKTRRAPLNLTYGLHFSTEPQHCQSTSPSTPTTTTRANMRSTFILSAFALVAPAMSTGMRVGGREAQELVARMMDPQTMDPMRLSVLSVLKTAMPTGADAPMPTGSNSPKWYQDLPPDIMILLAQMYPAEPTSDVVSATSAPAAVSSSLPGESSSSSQAVSGSPTSTASLQSTATPTTQSMSTGTSGSASPTATASSDGTLPAATQTPTPSPSGLPSAGTRATIRADALATVLGVGVGACFFLFA